MLLQTRQSHRRERNCQERHHKAARGRDMGRSIQRQLGLGVAPFVLAFGLATSASAADLTPLKAPRPVVSYNGFYAWLDGSYQSIRLPSYSLGFQRSVSFADRSY